MSSNEKVILYLKEVEDAADKVLSTKQEIVDLDRKRHSNREAIGAIEKSLKSDRKVWLAMGNSFIKLPREKAIDMLKKDQINLEKEVNILRTKLKDYVHDLRDKECKDRPKGFHLAAISREERKILGL